MIKAEFHYLTTHWFKLVVLAVIATIPAIYAVTFLKSMWDPYGQTDKLAVAVVNHDQRATMDGKTLNLGKGLVANLEDSKSLDFRHVSATKAHQGLVAGRYYAVYTIPEDFSQNATTVFSNHPQALRLKVNLSTGHNLFAGKIATTAGNSLQAKVNGQLDAAYTKTLVAGFKQVASGMQAASAGAGKLATGSHQLDSGVTTFQKGVTTAANGQQTLATSAGQLASGTQQYVGGVTSAQTGSQTLAAGLTRADNSLPALTNGLGQMATGTTTLANGLTQAQSGQASLAQGAAKLDQSLTTFSTSSATLSQKSQAFATALQSFATQVTQSQQTGGTDLSQLATLIAATQKALTAVSTTAAQTATATHTNVANVAAGMHLSDSQQAALTAAVDQTAQASAAKQTAALQPLLTQLQTALSSLQASATTQTQTGATMSGALTQLTSGAEQLADGNARLATAAGQLTAGADTVATGAGQLQTATAQLATGAQTLNRSLTAALPQVDQLGSGMAQLATGATQLNSGLTTLSQKGGTLASGSQQLTTGAERLAAGGQQLTAGTTTLQTGAHTVATGNQQLAAQLAAGTAKLPQLHFTAATNKMVTSPVKVSLHDRDTVPNNGTAMMPYMGGVALYVCAMAVNMMFDTVTPRRKPKNGVAWWASKAVVINLVALSAATVEYAGVVLLAGLRPTNGLATWLVLALASCTFMAIVSWLNLAFGPGGSFIAMVLLVLQLSSSGGTYPIALSNGFFEALNPLLPMSYVVDALRHTVMMHAWPGHDLLVLLGFFVAFSALLCLNYVRRAARTTAVEFDALDD
jgi:putative membrane protein